MKACLTAISMLLVTACGDDGPVQPDLPPVPPRQDTRFASGTVPDPGQPFSAAEETRVSVTPKIPGYALPLDLSQVANLDRDIRGKEINAVAGDAADKLARHGFVVVTPSHPSRRFSDSYEELKLANVPVFVTSDSVLHLYHLFFDQILKYLEVTEFSQTLSTMLRHLIASSLAQRQGFDGALKEGARRNAAFLSVAVKLLDPSFTVPAGLPEAAEELRLIEAHEALEPSPLMNHDCPERCDPCGIDPSDVECQAQGACTCEDYTQYIPRGHYTVSEELERYFKAMMWLGRIGFRIRSDMESIQAVLLTDALNATEIDGAKAADLWFRIYDVTGFLVGASDDLTFFEYQKAATSALGERFDLADLASPEKLALVKAALEKLRDPGILGGFLSAMLDETEHTKGWRFMGQRFAPDSYVLGQMVWDHIGPNLAAPSAAAVLKACGRPAATCTDVLSDLKLSNCICFNTPVLCRLMPKGLDVMAVLGSEQAAADLAGDRDYCGFADQLDALKTEFEGYTRDDWRQNVYWYWLDVLTPLLKSFPEGYPNWMRTEAWATKEQNTALASWAQLRHDTILYVKQSYTPAWSGSAMPPEMFGTVEPVPAFFARLKDLAGYTRAGLERHDALPEGLAPHLDRLVTLLDKLTAIAVKHLEDTALDQGEIETIKNIGDAFAALITGLAKAVKVEEPKPEECQEHPEYCIEHNLLQGDDPFKTSIVADVHTDVNSEQVLEEGSGYLEWIIVARQLPDGTIGASVGPVFSYYEFGHPMKDRLTDEKWNEMLQAEAPPRPAWSERIRAR